MAKPLSEDLRVRVIEAVDAGMSRRAAAERFGVSPASAVRFVGAWRESGLRRAKVLGGDRRSHRIEAHRERIERCTDAAKLDRWVRRAVVVKNMVELFENP